MNHSKKRAASTEIKFYTLGFRATNPGQVRESELTTPGRIFTRERGRAGGEDGKG